MLSAAKNLKSNEVKFFTKSKAKDDVDVKVTASLEKSVFKLGDRVKMTVKVKNVGNKDIIFASYNGSCVPSFVEFIIDGFHSDLQFFAEQQNDIKCINFADPMNLLNVKIKSGEEKTYTLNGLIPKYVSSNDYLLKKIKGSHTLQAKFYYPEAVSGKREFKSDIINFEIKID